MKRRDFLYAAGATGVILGLGAVPALAVQRDTMHDLRMDDDLRAHIAGLEALRNDPVTEADLIGRPVVVNFFASWCSPCHEEARVITDLHNRWGTEAIFLSINIFENFGSLSTPVKLSRFLEKHEQPNPNLRGTKKTPAKFGYVDRIPTVMVFDASGAMHYLFVHERGAEQMVAPKDALEAAVEEVVTAATFATQCQRPLPQETREETGCVRLRLLA